MASKDQASNIVHKIAFHIQQIPEPSGEFTGEINGQVIDTIEFESVDFIMQRGISVGGTATMQIRESNFNGEGTDPSFLESSTIVDANDLIGTIANTVLTECESSSRIGYVGRKRFVRLRIVFVSANDMDIGGTVILGNPHNNPTINEIDIIPPEE